MYDYSQPTRFRALSDAIVRIEAAERAADEQGAGIAAGEGLAWLRSIDEAAGNVGRSSLLRGFRWLRNRVLHDRLIEAVWLDGTTNLIGTFVIGESRLSGGDPLGPKWLSRDQLPDPNRNDPEGETAYDESVSGQLVLPTLRQARDELATVVGFDPSTIG